MPTLQDVEKAQSLLIDTVLHTPLVYSPYLSRLFHSKIFLKLENLQNTGSFKIRGAAYKLLTVKGKTKIREVVAASAGNHAQGVALAARQAGMRATLVMPEWASISKQEATRAYGGHVVIHGKSIGESLAEAKSRSGKEVLFIHPFDDPEIIAGQGTVGIEILQELGAPDQILVPVGGGGLIAGIAVAIKAKSPGTRIIGVQTIQCPAAVESRRQGKRVSTNAGPSLADGITVRQVGKLTFDIMQKDVDDLVTVNEDSIASAVLMLLDKKKVLAEGAGAVPLAALLEGVIKPHSGETVVLLVSGGNMDSPLIGRIITQGLIRNARVMRLSVALEDVPGSLASLLDYVARLKANVLHIRHDRNVGDLPMNISRVVLELEIRGLDHLMEIRDTLLKAGYAIHAELPPGKDG